MNMIRRPTDTALTELGLELSTRADALDISGRWPAEQVRLCTEAGVIGWSAPATWGGLDWSEADLLRGFMKLAAGCLSTAFVMTQPSGALRRIVACENLNLKERVVPGLLSGEIFASVGISHLTTSRRHLARPVMQAREFDDGFVLDGLCPWVTGGVEADYIVTGATLDDARQILVLLPTDLPGVSAAVPAPLVGLASTQTGEMCCQGVHVGREWLMGGPVENVLSIQSGPKTGGLQTSALALGLATSAREFLAREARERADLAASVASFDREHASLEADLLALAGGNETCKPDDLRSRANSHVLRVTQAALAAAKGTGYIQGHPAGRWCREALFFLVWSCPQNVMAAQLCELAGLG